MLKINDLARLLKTLWEVFSRVFSFAAWAVCGFLNTTAHTALQAQNSKSSSQCVRNEFFALVRWI
jgi:hypothetical protein